MLRPILLKNLPFTDSQMESVINNFLEETAKNIKIDFDVTTQTWRGRPDFIIETPKKHIRTIKTENEIYYFVSGGTRVRYATMTKNFRAKTVPNRIGSRKGRGGVAFISKLHPRPGIKARNFPWAVIKKQYRFHGMRWQTAINAELSYGRFH